jgi:hypothetical protein
MNSTWLNNLYIYIYIYKHTHTHTLKKQKQNKTGQKKKTRSAGLWLSTPRPLQGKARMFGLGFIILFFIANNMLSANPDFEHHSGGQKIRAEPLLLKKT